MSTQDHFESLFSELPLPLFARVERRIAPPAIIDPFAEALAAMGRCPAMGDILPGQQVAIAAGSREIAALPQLVRAVVQAVADRGARPFVVPAMGSHGGGTAFGQAAMLAALGVDETAVGAPILSSMETVLLGATAAGVPVHMDKQAFEADHTVVIARIKPHTDFHGAIESGVLKMLAVGLGKGEGAAAFHAACPQPSARIIEMANVVMDRGNVLCALAVVEDASHRAAILQAHPILSFLKVEPLLLKRAKALMPRIPCRGLDVLVVDWIGKNISGTGMDPNITGRPDVAGGTPEIARYIAVLGITPESHGNATGIGYADVTTRGLVEAMDREATFRNCLTSRDTLAQKIPTAVTDGAQALRCCLYCAGASNPRVVRIPDTLHLDTLYISHALLPEVDEREYYIDQQGIPFEACRWD